MSEEKHQIWKPTLAAIASKRNIFLTMEYMWHNAKCPAWKVLTLPWRGGGECEFGFGLLVLSDYKVHSKDSKMPAPFCCVIYSRFQVNYKFSKSFGSNTRGFWVRLVFPDPWTRLSKWCGHFRFVRFCGPEGMKPSGLWPLIGIFTFGNLQWRCACRCGIETRTLELVYKHNIYVRLG